VSRSLSTPSAPGSSGRPCRNPGRQPRKPPLICTHPEENPMRDLFFILITLVVFAIFALIVRGAEKL
jgi:hypothetical protein